MEEHISEAIDRIHERNARVETDKAWERSRTRIGAIAAVTYICATFLLWLIGAANYWLGALVPVLGFVLSTQSLPVLKRWWLHFVHKKN